MDIKIDAEIIRVIEVIAAIITIIGCMIAISIKGLKNSEDPFLRNYLIGVIVFLTCIWLLLRFTEGDNQRIMIQLVFSLTAFIALAFVVWRSIRAQAYCKTNGYPMPKGVTHTPYYFPYFVMFGAVLISIVTMVFVYTSIEANFANRLPIIFSIVALSVWSMCCRLVWQLIDQRIMRVWIERQKNGELSTVPDDNTPTGDV
jgi:small-conductance mechanosensitive channel